MIKYIRMAFCGGNHSKAADAHRSKGIFPEAAGDI